MALILYQNYMILAPKIKVSGIMRWYYPIYFEKISKEEYELHKSVNNYNL